MLTKIVMQDYYNRHTSKAFNGTALASTQALIDAQALAVDLDAVTTLGTSKVIVSDEVILTPSPTQYGNLDAGATLHCRLDNGKLYAFKIPGIAPAFVNVDGSVDIAAQGILDLIEHFQSGGEFTVSEGDLIVAVEYGELDR